MCGIVGQVRVTGGAGPIDRALVEAMNELIIHRGPDDDGFFFDDRVGMGMRRLSIIDLSTGKQPLHNEDRSVWVVFNGEIFNFQEIREGLVARGHRFTTTSDTEVIVHLYEEDGPEFVQRLRGMFAIALWDQKLQRLLVVRDRLGIKPLYYSYRDGTLLFASEMKSLLLSSQVRRDVDPVAVDQYLTFRFVPSPRTLLKDVAKLPPGHMLVVSDGELAVERYWDLEAGDASCDGIEQCQSELLQTMQHAVDLRLISDVPLGVLLSGGIDSSAIVAMMDRSGQESIKTFTIGFKGADDLNEFEDAQRIADRFKTDHHEMVVDASDYIGFLNDFVWHLDEPVGDFSAVAFYYITKLAREHVTVALTGQGADELFAGYNRYTAERISGVYRRVPRFLRTAVVAPLIQALPGALNAKRAVRSLGEEEFVARYLGINEVFEPALKARLLTPEFAAEAAESDVHAFLTSSLPADADRLSDLQKTLYLDTKYWLGDYLLLYTDKLSMANSLEARVPFLDHELFSECFRLPDEYKVRGTAKKYIFKQAMRGLVPDENIDKKKKGFLAPVNQWLRTDMNQYVRDLLMSDTCLSRGYFTREGMQAILDLNDSGRQDYGRHIFCLVLLETWFRVFVDTAPGRTSGVDTELRGDVRACESR